MKKKILPGLLMIFIAIFVVIFLFPIARYLYNYITPDDYDSKYEQLWVSDDGRISMIINSKHQMQGVGCYQGVYQTDKDCVDIDVIIDGLPRAYLSAEGENGENYIFLGNSYLNIFTNSYTVRVTEANEKISDYHIGDEIVFRKKEK